MYEYGVTFGIGVACVDARFDFALCDIFVEMEHFVAETEFFGHFALGAHIACAGWILADENDAEARCGFGRKVRADAFADGVL